MGKKKKKAGAAKSARAQSGTSSAAAVTRPQPLDREAQKFFGTQKRDVQSRVEWLQRRCDELELLNEQLQKKAVTLTEDMEEITEYLHDRVNEKTETCAELQEELRQLQEAFENEQRMYRLSEEKQEKEFKDTKEQLENDGLMTQGKLSALEDIRVAKEEMHEKFREMEAKMHDTKEKNKEEIYTEERKTVVQKDSLRKEMQERVSSVAAEFRKVSNRQMAETTRRTIEENAGLNRELADLSDRITKLISENDALKAKEKENQREIDVLTELEKEMLANASKSLKAIRLLADGCRDSDTQLIDMEERAENADSVRSEHVLLTQQADSLADELSTMRKEVANQEHQLKESADQFRREQRVNRRFLRLLHQCEKAVSDSYATLTPDEEMTESEAIILRRKMLISLLDLLNLAAQVGLGPEPGSLGRAGQPDKYEHQPAVGSRGTQPPRSRTSGSRGHLVSSRLSELGLAPKPISSRTEFVAEKLASQLPPGALLQPLRPRARQVPSGVF